MRGVVKQSLAVAGTQTHSDDFMRLRWVMCRMAGLAGISGIGVALSGICERNAARQVAAGLRTMAEARVSGAM
jgi:hypothetical protein